MEILTCWRFLASSPVKVTSFSLRTKTRSSRCLSTVFWSFAFSARWKNSRSARCYLWVVEDAGFGALGTLHECAGIVARRCAYDLKRTAGCRTRFALVRATFVVGFVLQAATGTLSLSLALRELSLGVCDLWLRRCRAPPVGKEASMSRSSPRSRLMSKSSSCVCARQVLDGWVISKDIPSDHVLGTCREPLRPPLTRVNQSPFNDSRLLHLLLGPLWVNRRACQSRRADQGVNLAGTAEVPVRCGQVPLEFSASGSARASPSLPTCSTI